MKNQINHPKGNTLPGEFPTEVYLQHFRGYLEKIRLEELDRMNRKARGQKLLREEEITRDFVRKILEQLENRLSATEPERERWDGFASLFQLRNTAPA